MSKNVYTDYLMYNRFSSEGQNLKNVECNAKEMVVALVAKTIFKPKNSVRTPFKSATNLRQGRLDCPQKFVFEVCATMNLSAVVFFATIPALC